MKRLSYFIFFLFAVFSCGKDSTDDAKDDIIDDKNENIEKQGNLAFSGIIDASTGLRLTKATNLLFKYDAGGRLEEIYSIYNGFKWRFDYKANIVSESFYGLIYNYFNGFGYYAISYNNDGYISSIKTTTESAYSASYSFSYDSNGHMKKCVSNINIPEGDYSNDASFSLSAIWDNNRIISMRCETMQELRMNGSVLSYQSLKNNIKFIYDSNTNGKYTNRFKQNVESIMYNYDITTGLQFLGALGKGPDILPSGREESKIQEESGIASEFFDVTTYEYIFNADGSIAMVKNNMGNKFEYSYDKVK